MLDAEAYEQEVLSAIRAYIADRPIGRPPESRDLTKAELEGTFPDTKVACWQRRPLRAAAQREGSIHHIWDQLFTYEDGTRWPPGMVASDIIINAEGG